MDNRIFVSTKNGKRRVYTHSATSLHFQPVFDAREPVIEGVRADRSDSELRNDIADELRVAVSASTCSGLMGAFIGNEIGCYTARRGR
jgi:hypothetical protein